MRLRVVSLILTGATFGQGEILSEGDRQALLERLESLEEGAGERATKRSGNALTAFRSAAGSDDQAHEFYIQCVEKVRFADEKRSASDFRDWKRRHKDKEDSEGFRRCLRYQLNWLLLMLEADRAGSEDAVAQSKKIVTLLDSMLGDVELLCDQVKCLEEEVTNTVFAQAYGVRAPEGWPKSPIKLVEVYRQVVLPAFEKSKDAEGLRKAWMKWIQQEALLAELKSGKQEKGQRSADFDKFLIEKRPQMLWDLEKAVFALGEQKGAALKMLEHLEEFQGHANEVGWTKEFKALLVPKPQG